MYAAAAMFGANAAESYCAKLTAECCGPQVNRMRVRIVASSAMLRGGAIFAILPPSGEASSATHAWTSASFATSPSLA